jgi:hypothetical protein
MTDTTGPGEIFARALSYPYEPPRFGYLFAHDAAVPQRALPGGLDIRPQGANQPPLVDLAVRLEDGTERHYSARVPLLAAGSNASFTRLKSKFSERGLATEFPVLLAQVAGLVPAYSAHISTYGSVPGTLVSEPGAVSHLHVAFVDARALALLNASEALGKNYALALIDGCSVELGEGARLNSALAYISMRGLFAPAGAPLRLAAFHAEGSSLEALHQREMLELLRRHLSFEGPLDDFVHGHVGDEGLRAARTREMARVAIDCGISGLCGIAGGLKAPSGFLPDGFGG